MKSRFNSRIVEQLNSLLKLRCKTTNCTYSLNHLITYSLLFIIYSLLFTLYWSNLSPVFAKKDKVITPRMEAKYRKKVLKQEAKEDYKRSLLPESGCMTVEEYENLSKDIPNSQKVVPEYKMPRDIKMKYVPQPTYSLARYNDPPGSAELHLPRRFKFDRQVNEGAITSPKKDILVYPTVYYYAINQCTTADLFVIPLDKSLPDVSRIQRANIIRKLPDPILSTEKNIKEKFIFRTLTPIDFSEDGTKLIAKEKIGNVNDGIWQTNLWVYDFSTKQARELHEIREAIKFYWLNSEGLMLDEKRWDIYPLGFDANTPNRVVVSAYGYTGKTPEFLGNWSIDCNGERAMLLSLFDAKSKISMNGYKIVQSGIVNPTEVYHNEKMQDKIAKKERKKDKITAKKDITAKKKVYKEKLKEIEKQK